MDATKPEILLVEDDPAVLASIRRRFQMEGFNVHTAVTGLMALEVFSEITPQLVILDLMLPELDGIQVVRELRKQSSTPILMLTARDSVADRVKGLEEGADDYLVKPFVFDELLARARALLRRSQYGSVATDTLQFAHLSLSPATRQVHSAGTEVNLTAREFDLLAYFLKNPRHVLTRERIMTDVWGYDYEGSSNVIDVYVRSLRDKLEKSSRPRLLQTVRGVGYVLRD
ncbi:MAG: response regulator transcription factor [Candidatus Eremiobacteraeota bacterium]|nr:response regulator transcription factor [Candidatus Eremiobacteraeota bacterium]